MITRAYIFGTVHGTVGRLLKITNCTFQCDHYYHYYQGIHQGAADLGSIPTFPVQLFSRSSCTCDLLMGTVAATLPGAWHDRVSAGTGWPGVGIL